jgi:hypothetical protein
VLWPDASIAPAAQGHRAHTQQSRGHLRRKKWGEFVYRSGHVHVCSLQRTRSITDFEFARSKQQAVNT